MLELRFICKDSLNRNNLECRTYEALRASIPTTEIECYIQKPVETKDLVRRINAELEQ